jgi:hypothetical protein
MRIRNSKSRDGGVAVLRRSVLGGLSRVVIVGVTFMALGALGAEGVGAYLADGVLTAAAHIAAVAIGLSIGYAAAVTVAFWVLLSTILHLLEWAAGQVEHLAGSVVHDAESVLRRSESDAGHHNHSTSALTLPGGRGRSSDGLSGGIIGGLRNRPSGPI